MSDSDFVESFSNTVHLFSSTKVIKESLVSVSDVSAFVVLDSSFDIHLGCLDGASAAENITCIGPVNRFELLEELLVTFVILVLVTAKIQASKDTELVLVVDKLFKHLVGGFELFGPEDAPEKVLLLFGHSSSFSLSSLS